MSDSTEQQIESSSEKPLKLPNWLAQSNLGGYLQRAGLIVLTLAGAEAVASCAPLEGQVVDPTPRTILITDTGQGEKEVNVRSEPKFDINNANVLGKVRVGEEVYNVTLWRGYPAMAGSDLWWKGNYPADKDGKKEVKQGFVNADYGKPVEKEPSAKK